MKKFLKKFIPKFILSGYHWLWVFLSAVFYGFPSRRLKVIGVTGTKGKSSTVFLTAKILEAAGHKVNWISSLNIKIGVRKFLNPFHMTMPGRSCIQRALRQAVKQNCDYFLLEVTSEGINQHRHRFINFDTAVFTNLAPEHLESHGGFGKYRLAKSRLFSGLKKSFTKIFNGQKIQKIIIANLDDENCGYFLRFPADKKIGFGLNPEFSNQKMCDAVFIHSDANPLFQTFLPGRFNLYNCLAAYAIATSQGIKPEIIKKVLTEADFIPGRLEEIKAGQNFRVFVDLAHTPESFRQVFETVIRFKPPAKKIIAVFGSAGGGRDKWKRPVLGEIAAHYAAEIVLTNEDPYNESPSVILQAIADGVAKNNFPTERLWLIENRRSGIKKGLELAAVGDIVLILGKGTESLYIVGGKKEQWNDRQVVREEIKKIKNQISNLKN